MAGPPKCPDTGKPGHDPVMIMTGQPGPDGSQTFQMWALCLCSCRELLDALGTPSYENIMPRESVDDIMATAAKQASKILQVWYD